MPQHPADHGADGERTRRRRGPIDTAVPPQQPDAPSGEVGSEGGSPGDLLDPPDTDVHDDEPGREAPARVPERDG